MNRTTNKNKSRVLRADNEAGANDGKRYILIFDNHPDSLRLLREVYLAPAEPTLRGYIVVSVFLIAALLVVIFWIA